MTQQLTRPEQLAPVDHLAPPQPPGRLADLAWRLAITGVMPRAFGATARRSRPLPAPPVFRPHVNSRRFSCTHYGIMIPDLPEPHRFLACASILGVSGTRVFDNDFTVPGRPWETATLVHGTAASTHDSFTSYSIPRECELREDGSLLRFGTDLEISGRYPNYRLRSHRPGFAADLELTATGEHTIFTRSPLWHHLSLLTRYTGTITQHDTVTPVSGLCTYEYAETASHQNLRNRPLSPRWKFPMEFFTYQVIDLDPDTQLLLCQVGGKGHAAGTMAYLRVAGKGAVRLGHQVRFQVLSAQPEPAIAPDGRPSQIARTFHWDITDRAGRSLIELTGTIDTPLHYGLGRGYVGGYHFAGTRAGEVITGRGYIEYVDGR